MPKTIEERANESVNRRIQGSFGYRAADSLIHGFNADENINVYKAYGGTKEGLANSLDLAIQNAKPEVDVKTMMKDLGVDAGEAQEELDEQQAYYDDMVKDRAASLKDLEKLFDKAPGEVNELSEYAVDNFQRVMDNLISNARKQYMRTRKADWANAVNAAVTPVLTDVMAKKVNKS